MANDLRLALNRLGVAAQPAAIAIGNDGRNCRGPQLQVRSPIDGSTLAAFDSALPEQVAEILSHHYVAHSQRIAFSKPHRQRRGERLKPFHVRTQHALQVLTDDEASFGHLNRRSQHLLAL